ncbi:hypothetical protein [Alloyangia pacifica]|uniref:hypothetical protein n=1 Tax=Alloyangia pacifica TaxID=311180 RepID=UPI001CD2E9E9|nr:hypothetical protein [Alloyangia pacifica]MCA0995328.1 hypothetical protein [Alloyangia pacifica]
MYKRLFTASLIFGAAALGPPVGEAQVPSCLPRAALVERLKSEFGERQIAFGLQSPETLFELWGSEDSGGYTLLLTRSDEISCVISAGGALVLVPQPPPGVRADLEPE